MDAGSAERRRGAEARYNRAARPALAPSMSPNPRTRRQTRRAPSRERRKPAARPEAASLVSLLAHSSSLTDVLPHLHQHALGVTGGTCSLLFEHNPRNGVMQATSAYALDTLPTDAWLPSEAEASAVADVFGRRTATLVPDLARQMPDLASRIETPAALLLPLAQGAERIGLLVIGFTRPPAAQFARGGSDIADAFLAALTLFRLKHREALQNDVRELLDEFAAGLSRSMNIALRLEAFCQGANRLFAADRTSVWIHDRRARHLILQASSASGYADAGQRIGADDPRAPAASAMRQRRAELVPGSYDLGTSTAMLTVPLRGYRRALGAIVFDGVRVDVGGELDLLDRADELGRQVSNAVENLQLLDEVIRSRHVLENAFDSIAHLVAVCDLRGQIVHANEAFANRAGVSREELFDRPLGTTVGPELGGWLSDLDRVHRPAGAPPAVCEVVDSILGDRSSSPPPTSWIRTATASARCWSRAT